MSGCRAVVFMSPKSRAELIHHNPRVTIDLHPATMMVTFFHGLAMVQEMVQEKNKGGASHPSSQMLQANNTMDTSCTFNKGTDTKKRKVQ